MTPIPDAVRHVLGQPGPVIFLDTCSLLDLFRHDDPSKQPRVPVEEVAAAAALLATVAAHPDAVHLIAPELVPGEFADHADEVERRFEAWPKAHDENQDWIAAAAPLLGLTPPTPTPVRPLALHSALRRLAEDLLARAAVLARDPTCLARAVARVIAKRRPSHKKEIKDSMNLEQCLELSAALRLGGLTHLRLLVSSNTQDFADPVAPRGRLHPDLQAEFAAAGLVYHASLRAALAHLSRSGQLP